MQTYPVGQRVQCVNKKLTCYGKTGTVTANSQGSKIPYDVLFDGASSPVCLCPDDIKPAD